MAAFVCEASVLQSDWQKATEKGYLFTYVPSCSACHARENSNKVILSEDFKFSNAEDVRDY